MAEEGYWALEPCLKLTMLATLCYNVLNTHIIRCGQTLPEESMHTWLST